MYEYIQLSRFLPFTEFKEIFYLDMLHVKPEYVIYTKSKLINTMTPWEQSWKNSLQFLMSKVYIEYFESLSFTAEGCSYKYTNIVILSHDMLFMGIHMCFTIFIHFKWYFSFSIKILSVVECFWGFYSVCNIFCLLYEHVWICWANTLH